MGEEDRTVKNMVVIDPVTRIEGHAKITIALDDAGSVSDCRFHVTEFRGFEEFCKGRPVWEMPSLTARTCGICPVSHLLAGARDLLTKGHISNIAPFLFISGLTLIAVFVSWLIYRVALPILIERMSS